VEGKALQIEHICTLHAAHACSALIRMKQAVCIYTSDNVERLCQGHCNILDWSFLNNRDLTMWRVLSKHRYTMIPRLLYQGLLNWKEGDYRAYIVDSQSKLNLSCFDDIIQ
jgi:hypothetical protein